MKKTAPVDQPTRRARAMAASIAGVATLVAVACSSGTAAEPSFSAPPPEPDATEEFAMTEEELASAITAVETEITACMSVQGWEYVPVAADEVSRIMATIHTTPGLTEEQYVEQYGFGVTTQPFQEGGARVFGQNVTLYESLTPDDRAAYETALLGTDGNLPTPTFLFALDAEDFSDTAGCTWEAVGTVFEPDQVSGAYLNPIDEQVTTDPRVVDALVEWSDCMRVAGYPSFDQETAEDDLRLRLATILDGRRDLLALSPAEQQALTDLQDAERAIAAADRQCSETHLEEVVTVVEEEVTGVTPD